MSEQDFYNRLKKNLKKGQALAKKWPTEAYRIYERDLPNYPFIIDIYQNNALVWFKSPKEHDDDDQKIKTCNNAIKELLGYQDHQLFIKKRAPRTREDQTQKLDDAHQELTLKEGPFSFKVNLSDYLDTGLFLDHRPLRRWIYKEVLELTKKHENVSFLNLFCYTCSMSVAAGLGGAITTNIDLSKKYLEWGKENFELNSLDQEKHEFISQDAMSAWPQELFDLIYIDPPTFSNSKKAYDFDVQLHHQELIERAIKSLKPHAHLYFSCNKRDFTLDKALFEKFHIEDKTSASIPEDFKDVKIHKLYKIRLKDV